MKIFNIEDIKPIDVRLINDALWITYIEYINDNYDIEKGIIILYNNDLYEVEYDAENEDGYTAICKPYRPDQYPAAFVETLADDVKSKYVEWIKTN